MTLLRQSEGQIVSQRHSFQVVRVANQIDARLGESSGGSHCPAISFHRQRPLGVFCQQG
jgi:hypothetical protein